MTRFYAERVGFKTLSTGDTGDIAIGTRLAPSFRIPSETSITEGRRPLLLVQENSDFMIVDATYTAAPALSVDEVILSVIGGTVGTTRMSLDGDAEIRFLPPIARDLEKLFVRTDVDQALTEAARLKALTNLGIGDLDLQLSVLQMGMADALNVAQFSGNRFADSFDTLTYVDTGGATNLDATEAGILKPTHPHVQIDTTSLAKIGSLNGGGGLNAAFDSLTSQTQAAGAGGVVVSAAGYNNTAGIDWGVGVTKKVSRVRVYGPNDANVMGAAGGTNFKLEGSTNNSSYPDLAGVIPFAAGAPVNTDVTTGINKTTGYRYHRVNFEGNAVNAISLAEVQFFEAGPANNATVASQALAAAAAPGVAKLLARVKEIDAISLNIDIIVSVSRDGGTTYTPFVLTKKFTNGDISLYESAELDISGQPSGTSMKWKLVSANNKAFELRDVRLFWE